MYKESRVIRKGTTKDGDKFYVYKNEFPTSDHELKNYLAQSLEKYSIKYGKNNTIKVIIYQ